MRILLSIITLIVLTAACNECCYQVKCDACPPFQSSETILFMFDSARFDSFWAYPGATPADTSPISIPLCAHNHRIPFRAFGDYPKLGTPDGARTWTAGATALNKTKGTDCCDCGTETMAQITINDTLYALGQLPLPIK